MQAKQFPHCVCSFPGVDFVLQDVNKDPGAEDTFKAIGEAYEVRNRVGLTVCNKGSADTRQTQMQQRNSSASRAWLHMVVLEQAGITDVRGCCSCAWCLASAVRAQVVWLVNISSAAPRLQPNDWLAKAQVTC